ncbi:GIY-YIG nuclease family protein [Shouchella shacheensis]|uniref:GIY-YIG nuclease family protein n=1 Tax=Shouchella shacheensis TaxID=1649580 RepID=UPI000B2FAA19
MKHVMYVLECKDGSWYTGYTNDFEHRLAVHESGRGAKYTRGRGPFSLIWKEEFETKSEAMRAEYQFKKFDRPKKEAYIVERRSSDERAGKFPKF